MIDQDNGQISTLQCPATDDPELWKKYWEAQGQLWRTEPEIDADRKKYLAERRAIVPDIKQGIYPFKDVKLSRADIVFLTVHKGLSVKFGKKNSSACYLENLHPLRQRFLDVRS